MVCSSTPYKVSIPIPESFDYFEQRVQIVTHNTVWDVCWDSLNLCIICFDTEQNFYQIRLDTLDSDQITISTVMTAFGYSDYSIHPGYLVNGVTEEELLGLPLSADILFQMDVN